VQLDEAGDDFAPLEYDRALPVRPRLRRRDQP
jgi:hypothetical protein